MLAHCPMRNRLNSQGWSTGQARVAACLHVNAIPKQGKVMPLLKLGQWEGTAGGLPAYMTLADPQWQRHGIES